MPAIPTKRIRNMNFSPIFKIQFLAFLYLQRSLSWYVRLLSSQLSRSPFGERCILLNFNLVIWSCIEFRNRGTGEGILKPGPGTQVYCFFNFKRLEGFYSNLSICMFSLVTNYILWIYHVILKNRISEKVQIIEPAR